MKPDVLRILAPVWNLVIPKHAVGTSVGRDPDRAGAIRYLHATKGWRTVSKERLAMVGVAV